MACLGCSCTTTESGSAKGCRSNGGCGSGGCNRHNTYDWITALGIRDALTFDVVEVSFKNGSRKDFYKNPPFTRASTGDHVLVESASGGYDVGRVSLSGELVRLQMKRKRVRPDAKLQSVVRKAHERDLERLDEWRRQEKEIMVRARAIARTLDLNMKVGDVEFQGDGRKCTFYYTADGRVDFRELIRHYAKEFRVKIEMRQIGARQESARIGGIGNCGRELCCATWLTEFKSVNTAAARYQNLAINQTKLSGMCGRLKCCLNYELDTYVDALEDFPDKAERIKTSAGLAVLVKTDVFKRLMFYTYADNKSKFFPLHVDQVWEVLDMVKRGELPGSLEDVQAMAPESDEPEEEVMDFENVHNVIQLPMEQRKKKKKKKKGRGDSVAAAVENAGRSERPPQNNRPGSRPPRPERNGTGGSRPGARPNDRPGGQRPDQRPARPEGGPDQRPPRPPRPDPRPPRPDGPVNQPPAQRPSQGEPRPAQPPRPTDGTGDGSQPAGGRERSTHFKGGKNRFQGRPPKKD